MWCQISASECHFEKSVRSVNRPIALSDRKFCLIGLEMNDCFPQCTIESIILYSSYANCNKKKKGKIKWEGRKVGGLLESKMA